MAIDLRKRRSTFCFFVQITSPLTEPEELTPRKSKRLIEGFVSNGLLFDFVREEVHC